jgi:hypothetical protein
VPWPDAGAAREEGRHEASLPAPRIAHIIDGLLANNRIRAALDHAQ